MSLRNELAELLADENGIAPTRAMLDVLLDVIDALEQTDADWTEADKPGAPGRTDYAESVYQATVEYA